MLKISEIRIKKINKENFLGYASILVEDSIIIDGIELHEGKKGRYILMPLSRKKNVRRNSAYPMTEEARTTILQEISAKYDEGVEV